MGQQGATLTVVDEDALNPVVSVTVSVTVYLAPPIAGNGPIGPAYCVPEPASWFDPPP